MSEQDGSTTPDAVTLRARQPGEAARLDLLDSLDTRPLHEHADVYQQLHADLQAALAEIDSA